MKTTLMKTAAILVALVATDKAVAAAESGPPQGQELALAMFPVDQVVTGDTRWKHAGTPRMPTSRDNRKQNDESTGAQ